MKYKTLSKYILLVLGFFVIETFFYNELALFLILLVAIFFEIFIIKGNKKLFVIGTCLGLIIEGYMGVFSRTQYWSNTLYFAIPLWLPLAWGYGFVLIHKIGILLDKS